MHFYRDGLLPRLMPVFDMASANYIDIVEFDASDGPGIMHVCLKWKYNFEVLVRDFPEGAYSRSGRRISTASEDYLDRLLKERRFNIQHWCSDGSVLSLDRIAELVGRKIQEFVIRYGVQREDERQELISQLEMKRTQAIKLQREMDILQRKIDGKVLPEMPVRTRESFLELE